MSSNKILDFAQVLGYTETNSAGNFANSAHTYTYSDSQCTSKTGETSVVTGVGSIFGITCFSRGTISGWGSSSTSEFYTGSSFTTALTYPAGVVHG